MGRKERATRRNLLYEGLGEDPLQRFLWELIYCPKVSVGAGKVAAGVRLPD